MCSSERCLIQPEQQGGLATYVFTPSLFQLVPKRIRNCFSVTERAKLLLRVLRGYYVYYQTQNDRLVSYCFLKRNYLGKYPFLSKNDVLINPYFVSKDYRGRGLGGKLIDTAIKDTQTAWERVYALVMQDNLPSIRTLEKLQFERIGYSDKRGWSHRITERKTHLPVFCLTRTEEQEKTQ